MIHAQDFIQQAKELGFTTYSGVPCSFLKPLINYVIDSPDIQYIGAANEGDAVAIASGAALAGTRGVALMQNSGLGNAVSPLTSLNAIFKIPILLIITWRGEPTTQEASGKATRGEDSGSDSVSLEGATRAPNIDEPQHELMGKITLDMLRTMNIQHEAFPKNNGEISDVLLRATRHMDETGLPYALVMKKGDVTEETAASRTLNLTTERLAMTDRESNRTLCHPDENRDLGLTSTDYNTGYRIESGMTPHLIRDEVLQTLISSTNSQDAIISTTGYTSRALYSLRDSENQLYVVGSMGCASSLALGAALNTKKRVFVLDGDGAALMRMGALSTIGNQKAKNLTHIILDNGMHESTGGQHTATSSTNLAEVARACRYSKVVEIQSLEELEKELTNSGTALTCLYIKTSASENKKLPRPTVTPEEVKARFSNFLKNIA